jgi:hypothetical protein
VRCDCTRPPPMCHHRDRPGAPPAPMPNMESTDSVTLILRITGADLSLYKQSKITRAEAKARIRISEERR